MRQHVERGGTFTIRIPQSKYKHVTEYLDHLRKTTKRDFNKALFALVEAGMVALGVLAQVEPTDEDTQPAFTIVPAIEPKPIEPSIDLSNF